MPPNTLQTPLSRRKRQITMVALTRRSTLSVYEAVGFTWPMFYCSCLHQRSRRHLPAASLCRRRRFQRERSRQRRHSRSMRKTDNEPCPSELVCVSSHRESPDGIPCCIGVAQRLLQLEISNDLSRHSRYRVSSASRSWSIIMHEHVGHGKGS